MIYSLFLAWLMGSGLMVASWLAYLWRRTPGIVDMMWAPSIFLMGVVYFLLAGHPHTLIQMVGLGVTGLWALRLAGYLWWARIRKRHVDRRYQAMESGWRTASMGYLLNYQLQVLFQLAVSVALYFLAVGHNPINGWAVGFIGIFLIALGGETLSDFQLNKFKQIPSNKGMVCNVGLWRYSRHPNYFFEWMIWLSFSGLGWVASGNGASFFSCVAMYAIFKWVTGPITERESIRSRGDAYIQYQQNTPFLFPVKSRKVYDFQKGELK